MLPWELIHGTELDEWEENEGMEAAGRRELGAFTLISSSETVRTSSTKSLMMGHVLGPMLVLTASAMVSRGSRLGVSSPLSLDW